MNEGLLRWVTYDKQRPDTYLRVAFHTTLAESKPKGCSQWDIRFDGGNCTQPAPINSVHFRHMDNVQNIEWNIRPAVISGICLASSNGSIGSGIVNISVHVQKCTFAQNRQLFSYHSQTGSPNDVESTSFLLIEEYCQN